MCRNSVLSPLILNAWHSFWQVLSLGMGYQLFLTLSLIHWELPLSGRKVMTPPGDRGRSSPWSR